MVKFLNDRICLNCLTQSVDNAKSLYEVTEGHILLGLLSADYDTNEEAITDMKLYQEVVDNAISVGLGSGNPNNWKRVSDISEVVKPQHINQVFSGIGYTRGRVGEEVFINCLVSPTENPKEVIVSTGPLSSKAPEEARVPVETAVLMAKEMGANSMKFFPMKGLEAIDGLRELAKVCAKHDFALEPTGGIDLDNFEEIIDVALSEGVKHVIPHVYSSIIETETSIEAVKQLYDIMKRVSEKYR